MNEVFLQYIAPALGTALGTIITAVAGYFLVYLNKKKKALQQELDNDIASKYLDMIEQTITDCVIATNQTYVETLKKQDAFTPEAQEVAFQKTLNAVLAILTDDCKLYLESVTNDVTGYLEAKIESEVNLVKL